MYKRILTFFLILAVPVLALTAQVRPLLLQPTDPLFGTWVNPAYESASVETSAKVVMFPDGSEFDYYKISDLQPYSAGSIRLEAAWIDEEGNHWYKAVWVGDYHPLPTKAPRYKLFSLMKINAAGTILESISGDAAYPKDLKDSSLRGTPMQYRLQ
jgi:hypothetical protein